MMEQVLDFIQSLINLIIRFLDTFNYFTKMRYIKNVLGFKKGMVNIFLSIRTLQSDEEVEKDFVTSNVIHSFGKITQMLGNVNFNFKLPTERDLTVKNEINIGGFVTNSNVKIYFNEHFKDFKYIVDNSRIEKERYKKCGQIVVPSIEYTGFKANEIILKTDQQHTYAFVIKMIHSDFPCTDKNTVHIFFGEDSVATLNAVNYFTSHYKEIYKRFKKNHYFFALYINRKSKSVDTSRDIIDLTDEMF